MMMLIQCNRWNGEGEKRPEVLQTQAYSERHWNSSSFLWNLVYLRVFNVFKRALARWNFKKPRQSAGQRNEKWQQEMGCYQWRIVMVTTKETHWSGRIVVRKGSGMIIQIAGSSGHEQKLLWNGQGLFSVSPAQSRSVYSRHLLGWHNEDCPGMPRSSLSSFQWDLEGRQNASKCQVLPSLYQIICKKMGMFKRERQGKGLGRNICQGLLAATSGGFIFTDTRARALWAWSEDNVGSWCHPKA